MMGCASWLCGFVWRFSFLRISLNSIVIIGDFHGFSVGSFRNFLFYFSTTDGYGWTDNRDSWPQRRRGHRGAVELADMAVRAPVHEEHPLTVFRDGSGKANAAEVVAGTKLPG